MRELEFVGWLGIAALVGACSAGGESASVSSDALATAFKNDEAAYLYFLGKGLTNVQSAAIVGNLDQESGVDPTISQSGGGVGRGIAQWSTGGRWDTAKGDNLKDFAAGEGKPMTDLGVQLDFIWFELMTFPDDYGLTALKASTNVTDATQVVEDKFEGCVYAQYPECALPNRVKFAMDVLAAYGNDAVPGGGGSGGSGGASSGGASSGGAGVGGVTSSAGMTSSAGAAGAVGGGGAASSSGGAATASGGGGATSTVGGGGATSSAAGAATTSSAGTSSTAPRTTTDSSSCAVAEVGLAKSNEHGLVGAGLLLGLTALARGKSRKKSA